MKQPPFLYHKAFLSERRSMALYLVSKLLICSYMFEIREVYYRQMKNPKSYQDAELISLLMNIQYGMDKKPEELLLSEDEHVNKIIDCTKSLQEGEQMLSEALYIEKAFVEYFIKEVKSVPELHRTIQKIGGIASTMFEILGEYDLEKTPKEECEYWLRFFQNNNPMEKVTGARLRRLFTQTLDLFWETFATFYDVDTDATYDFDVPLQE